jgi:UDP-glucose 4-epimerase
LPLRPALAWVVGRGGLLGARTEALLPQELSDATCWTPDPPEFSWQDPTRLSGDLDRAIEAFAGEVRRADRLWLVLWCAGAGGIGTPTRAFEMESAALRHLVDRLAVSLADREPARQGLFLLSSSAGGVYGDNPEVPLTEDSRCSPISEYGRNKLAQEEFVLDWARSRPNVSCLVARFSNLYGPGQNLARPQGLIAQLSRSIIHRQPVHIYVPLDTLRDYLFVDDAARQVLGVLRHLRETGPPSTLVKIFAAGQSVSIAGVIGMFARISKRPPRIVCMPHARHRQQPLRLQFRSRRALDGEAPPMMIDLTAGIHAMLHHHLVLYQQGRLPA